MPTWFRPAGTGLLIQPLASTGDHMDDLTPNRELVPVPELPAAVTALANEYVRRFCVSMVVVTDVEVEGSPCAGVLCTICGVAGILTAWHVWDRLSRAKRLVLMLGPKEPYRIERAVLNVHAPAQLRAPELCGAMVPDLAFIPLSFRDKAVVEAKQKAFYSVDRRRNQQNFDLFGDAGFWVAVGTPVEMMRRESQAVGSLSYITDVEKKVERGEWDYLYVNLNLESNAPIPANLEGMSGGGLWRVRFTVTGDPRSYAIENPSQDIVLQGITFLQTELGGRQLIAHGPKSIYQRMPEVIGELR